MFGYFKSLNPTKFRIFRDIEKLPKELFISCWFRSEIQLSKVPENIGRYATKTLTSTPMNLTRKFPLIFIRILSFSAKIKINANYKSQFTLFHFRNSIVAVQPQYSIQLHGFRLDLLFPFSKILRSNLEKIFVSKVKRAIV